MKAYTNQELPTDEAHIAEVVTGESFRGPSRPRYALATRTLKQRTTDKAEELHALGGETSARTFEPYIRVYRALGLPDLKRYLANRTESIMTDDPHNHEARTTAAEPALPYIDLRTLLTKWASADRIDVEWACETQASEGKPDVDRAFRRIRDDLGSVEGFRATDATAVDGSRA